MKKAANPISIGIAAGCFALRKSEVPLLQLISHTRRNIHNLFGLGIEGHYKFIHLSLFGKISFQSRNAYDIFICCFLLLFGIQRYKLIFTDLFSNTIRKIVLIF